MVGSSTQAETPLSFPFPAPPSIFHPAPELSRLQQDRPVAPVRFPDGNTGWLVTRYDDVRQVLTDPRFSRAAATGPGVSEHRPRARWPPRRSSAWTRPSTPGCGALWRGRSPPRRVEALRPRVAQLVDELIDGCSPCRSRPTWSRTSRSRCPYKSSASC